MSNVRREVRETDIVNDNAGESDWGVVSRVIAFFSICCYFRLLPADHSLIRCVRPVCNGNGVEAKLVVAEDATSEQLETIFEQAMWKWIADCFGISIKADIVQRVLHFNM